MSMCTKWLLLVTLLIVFLLPMVVHASNTMLPVSKNPFTGLQPDGVSRRHGGIFMRTNSQITVSNGRQCTRNSKSKSQNERISFELETPKRKCCQSKFLAKREATPHSAPFIVSLQLMTADNGFIHHCAGTIINENWILTAAHCLSSTEVVENSVIVAGAHDIRAPSTEADHVQIRSIDYYVTHELYVGGVAPYDIALVYTKTPLQFTDYVQPAKLPEQNVLPDGHGILYGWGNRSMTSVPSYPHKLQEADMPILDMELCEKILAGTGLPLHATNLCTGPLTGGVSICTADSGGPLIQHFDESNMQVVIGIVSWGKKPCGQANSPSVFVRVSAFTEWINQIITTSTHFH